MSYFHCLWRFMFLFQDKCWYKHGWQHCEHFIYCHHWNRSCCWRVCCCVLMALFMSSENVACVTDMGDLGAFIYFCIYSIWKKKKVYLPKCKPSQCQTIHIYTGHAKNIASWRILLNFNNYWESICTNTSYPVTNLASFIALYAELIKLSCF